jgi:hypothetical protein
LHAIIVHKVEALNDDYYFDSTIETWRNFTILFVDAYKAGKLIMAGFTE